MKKVLFGIVMVLVFSMVAPLSFAYSGGIQEVAKYFPSDFEFLATIRTDDGYVDDLQGVFDRVVANLPASVASMLPATNIREALDQSLASNGLSYDSVRTWLGDCVAFGVQDLSLLLDNDTSNDSNIQALFLLEIKDRAFLDTFLKNMGVAETVGTFSVVKQNNAFIAINDKWLAVTTNTDFLPGSDSAKLDSAEGYQKAVNALPAESYNALVYANLADWQDLIAQMPNAEMLMGFLPQNVAVGATILNGESLAIDAAQDAAPALSNTPISADFANLIPADADLVVHTENLTAGINYLLDVAQMSQPTGANAPDPEQQLTQVAAIAGLKLDEDILSWTTGNYAIFAGVDYLTIFQALRADATSFPTVPGTFGLVIEATDAAKASKVVTNLSTALSGFLANQKDVTIELQQTVGDFSGTVVTAVTPSPEITVQIFIGSNNQALYIGTLNGAQAIANGDTLNTNATFQKAQTTTLSNATLLAYTNGDGVVTMVGVPLVVLTPSIGAVFSNVIGDLSGTPVPTATPIPLIDQTPLVMIFDILNGVIDSTSITLSNEGDMSLSRSIITLK